MRTSPHITFGIGYAAETKQDSIPSMPDLQAWSKINDLRTDSATSDIGYATYEPNYWLLDGNFKFLPANLATVHVGIITTAMSDAAGNFASPPVMTINFTTTHTIESFGLRGELVSNGKNYPTDIDIAYYDIYDALIRADNYKPDDWEFTTGQTVTGIKKMTVSFNSTNNPYRYLRITGMDFGRVLTFDSGSIKAATVVEEANPVSTELRIGTLTLSLFSSDSAFSIINPEGKFAALNQRQPISIYETIDSTTLFMGQYYLDTWQNKSDTEIEFKCVDLLGVLDTLTCRGGMYAAGITLYDLLESILTPIFIPYDLDTSLNDIMVYGWIPICSYREVLQQIAFAAGATVNCSRERPIRISPVKIAANEVGQDITLTKAQKGIEQTLSLRPLVTGVEITTHDYLVGGDSKELYNGNLTVGVHEITFSEAMYSLEVTGATITDSGANYATLTVADEGTVVLSGINYVDTQSTYGKYTAGLDTTVKPNVLKVTNATLVNSLNVSVIGDLLYDYYQQRMVQNFKLFASTAAVGDVVLIDTLYNKTIHGVIEKMSIDLAFGMIEQVEIVGV